MAKPPPFPFKKGKPANSKSVPPRGKKSSATDPDRKAEQRCMTSCMKQSNHMACMKKCMGGGM